MRAMRGKIGLGLGLGLGLGVMGCGGGAGKVGADPAGTERPVFRWCEGRPFTPAPRVAFRHTDSLVLSLASDPNHSAEDAISPASGSASLVARLAYGLLATPLNCVAIVESVKLTASPPATSPATVASRVGTRSP